MSALAQRLADLSAKATQGEWKASPYPFTIGSQIWAGEPGPDSAVIIGDADNDADAALAATLVNAFRAGELVVAHHREQAAAEQRGMIAGSAWQPIETAPRDGTEILILAHGMAIQARYCPGEWSDDTPICPAEYSGAVWCAFDDALQFEIEEGAGEDGRDWDGQVTNWMPLPAPPAIATMPMTAAPMHEISLPPEMKGMVIGGEDA